MLLAEDLSASRLLSQKFFYLTVLYHELPDIEVPIFTQTPVYIVCASSTHRKSDGKNEERKREAGGIIFPFCFIICSGPEASLLTAVCCLPSAE